MTDPVRVELPSSPGAAGVARQAIRDAELPQIIVEEVVLVASELVTNAVVHGAPPVTMTVWTSVDGVTVEVCDTATGEPRVRTLERSDAPGGGRGLHIVDQVATRWGVRPVALGKCVWALVCPSG